MFYSNILLPTIKAIEEFGERNAFCIDGRFYNYREFADSISSIRAAIRRVTKKRSNIGLMANDDLETYASIYAIWLEGSAYVPLHPKQPLARNSEIMDQAQIEIVVDSNRGNQLSSKHVICTTELNTGKLNLSPEEVPEDSLAYLLFTSGSTGKPKGVQISRRNVGAFMKAFGLTGIHITGNDRCLQCFDLTFDVSVQSFLVPLTKGACVFSVPHSQIKYNYVYGLLEEHEITFGAMPPSLIRFLRPYFDEIILPGMRYCILTAEACPVNLISEWSKCIPNAEIFDFYGPTEATIYCTYKKFKREGENKQLNGMMSIGQAFPGVSAVIIDGQQHILGKNQYGELCVSGDQITPGYWNNPEKNVTSFFNLEQDGTMTRFYKTGDSCYFDDDGDIMLAGRLDHQIKIQGYRIELEEIEYHAREYLEGKNAVACSFKNDQGIDEIAIFIEGDLHDEQSFVLYLKSKLPSYMIPSKFMTEKIFPLNINGKIDRNKLKSKL